MKTCGPSLYTRSSSHSSPCASSPQQLCLIRSSLSDDGTHFRVFGRYCLAGAALDGDADWNWGGDIKNEARGAVAGLLNVSAAAAPVYNRAWVERKLRDLDRLKAIGAIDDEERAAARKVALDRFALADDPNDPEFTSFLWNQAQTVAKAS